MSLPDLTAQPGDEITGSEPVPITNASPPGDVMRAVGFNPDLVQSVVVTPHGIVAVAADYPGTEPAPTPDPPTEEAPDAPA